MRESKLQEKCLNWLREHHAGDVLPANVHGGGWSLKGFPDLLCCVRGRYVAFELKVGENDMQSDQRIWKRRILAAGGLHYCPRTLDEFIECVNDAIEKGDSNDNIR